MKHKLGKLFILSGPSQVGKTTVARALTREQKLKLSRIITNTTRPRRPEDRADLYHFRTRRAFERLIEEGQLLEWARVHGYYYGTPRQPVVQALGQGRNVVLVIDVQGARQVRRRWPAAVTIFITAESRVELKRRIFESSHIPENQKARRWHTTLRELRAATRYDYIVVNHWNRLERTVREVSRIIHRCLR